MKKTLILLAVITFSLAIQSCNSNLEKGKIITPEQFLDLNADKENNDKRFAVVGYPHIDGDIELNSAIDPMITIFTEPGGKGKYVASLPVPHGEGKNKFHVPENFTANDIKFYDNEGNQHNYNEKLQFSFTLSLQTNRARMKLRDKLVYYGSYSDLRIDKAN